MIIEGGGPLSQLWDTHIKISQKNQKQRRKYRKIQMNRQKRSND